MQKPLAGVPEVLATADLDAGAAHLTVDASIYPLEALYGASFTFIDRCYVFLDRPDAGRFRVVLAPKQEDASEEALRALVGEYANELLACAWRHRITQENRAAIESVTMQALAGAMGPPTLDELEDFDFSEEPFEDPLGIAMSWEEKYGAKKQGREMEMAEAARAPAEDQAGAGDDPAAGPGGEEDA